MRRNHIFLACFLILIVIARANCFAQQYPFVHYSPKDGLVSNRVRSIYQDSKGLMYFLTMNGLSVYDGTRFTNYTSEEGLENDIVNCVMEMGDDSLWVITNTGQINCLVRKKLKTFALNSSSGPVINHLCRGEDGQLYAAADDGLFIYQQKSFTKLPFTDMQGKNIDNYITFIVPAGNYLLCLRDQSLTGSFILYLYDCLQKRIVSQSSNTTVTSISQSKDGRIWASTGKGMRQIDKTELFNGKIVFQKLPAVFKNIADKMGYVFFDNDNNCWVVEGNKGLTKVDSKGNTITYTSSSGLNTTAISCVFHDKEGIIWLASNGGGVDKLMHTNFTLIENPFGLSSPADISFSSSKPEMLLYSRQEEKLVRFTDIDTYTISRVIDAGEIGQIVETSKGTFGIGEKKIFRLRKKNFSWQSEVIFNDTSSKGFGFAVADHFENILIAGHNFLTVIGRDTVFRAPVNYLADQIACDKNGNIWIANRLEELENFKIHPGNSPAYLRQHAVYKKEVEGIAPRSIALDKEGHIWVGTRYKGIFIFKIENDRLIFLHRITSHNGLSENFVSFLACDQDNNIWACTPSGLDKISVKNDRYIIENLTRQNNIYPGILKVSVDNNRTAWALLSSGLIKITPERQQPSGYTPQLMFMQIRAGTDTINDVHTASFSYKKNNLSFHFSAPSFMDEKQILYSYQLQGSTTNAWTEPSNNAWASFIDLRPGNYTLNIKARFPAGRYAEQLLQYKFSISAPWWQTWWFRFFASLLVSSLVIFAFRFYYHRKLEKQQTILDRQQAIEQERNRIAADMHDDLGAGLTKIKYLTEDILEKLDAGETAQPELQKLKGFSSELVESMGEIIWAASEKNNLLSNTLYYLRSYAVNYCEENNMNCHFEIPGTFKERVITGNFRRNIFLLLKEGLHNIVKHAEAKTVTLKVTVTEELQLFIKDDGKGFSETERLSRGNGVINMKKRVLELNGSIRFENVNGTAIVIDLPFATNQSTID